MLTNNLMYESNQHVRARSVTIRLAHTRSGFGYFVALRG